MLNSFKRVLVLSAHPDDAEIGCGGTIARLVENGSQVTNWVATLAEKKNGERIPKETRIKEIREASAILGITCNGSDLPHRELNLRRQSVLDRLCMIKNEFNPDLVFLPCSTDLHQDHQVVHSEGLRAFKDRCVLGYEMLWNNLTFNATAFIKIDEEHIKKKVRALKCYTSQAEKGYLDEKFIRALAIARGIQIASEGAESFEVLHWVL